MLYCCFLTIRRLIIVLYKPIAYCDMYRKFSSAFISIAKRITELQTTEASTRIHFAALDCVTFSKLCSRQHINFYPSIEAYYFDVKKEPVKLQGIGSDIIKFLRSNFFKVTP
jgi:hypothetical protein